MSDEQLARRFRELRYRMIEIAIDPDHPASRANGARWRQEYRQVERACDRRGLLEPRTTKDDA